MDELWKPVSGYDGVVEVSSLGRVRNNNLGITYRLHKCKQGYPRVGIRFKGKPKKMHTVHRLVAEAFIEGLCGRDTVNHINGCQWDNRVENLEWLTQAENNAHAYQIGLKNNDHLRVVPRQVVDYIKANYIRYDKCFGATPMSRKFGLSITQVHRIAIGMTYN